MIIGDYQQFRIIFPNDNTGTAAFCFLGNGFSAVAVTEQAEIILYLLYRFVCNGYNGGHYGLCNIGNIQAALSVSSTRKRGGLQKAGCIGSRRSCCGFSRRRLIAG